MTAFLSGFALGLSLIVAIGAQNAFVLRQGLLRNHVLWVALTCAFSDAILIAAGVSGFGVLVGRFPWFGPVMTWGGAAFLLLYGANVFRLAWTGGSALRAAEGTAGSLRATVLTCFAFTWLNPHVYLDTVVLIGSVSSGHPDARLEFGAGAMLASFVFFFGLAYGARLLAPIFVQPVAWRVLDAGIGVLVWGLAFALVLA